jgi:hypothetical protein
MSSLAVALRHFGASFHLEFRLKRLFSTNACGTSTGGSLERMLE